MSVMATNIGSRGEKGQRSRIFGVRLPVAVTGGLWPILLKK